MSSLCKLIFDTVTERLTTFPNLHYSYFCTLWNLKRVGFLKMLFFSVLSDLTMELPPLLSGALQCFMSMQNHKINSDVLKHTRIRLSSWSRCLAMFWVSPLSSVRHVSHAWNYMVWISIYVSVNILPFSLNSFLCLLAWIYLLKAFLFFLARTPL